jgi:hypothetical protein
MSTSSLTKEDWQQIERLLRYPGAVEYLQCDQYLVTLQVGVEKMRMYICVYVDGWFKGEWCRSDCDIRRRFLCPIKDNFFRRTPTNGRSGKPYVSKKVKKQGEFTYYVPTWRSFASLRKHLIKNNTSIHRVEFNEGRARVERLLAECDNQEASCANQS